MNNQSLLEGILNTIATWPDSFIDSHTALQMREMARATIGTLNKQVVANASAPSIVDEREAFEAWIKRPPFEHMCDMKSDASAWPGKYKRYETELAWEAWQARAALSSSTSEQERIDVDRLNSSSIMISDRNEFGEKIRVLHTGINLRKAIDKARAAQEKSE